MRRDPCVAVFISNDTDSSGTLPAPEAKGELCVAAVCQSGGRSCESVGLAPSLRERSGRRRRALGSGAARALLVVAAPVMRAAEGPWGSESSVD